MSWSINPNYKQIEQPWKQHHNKKVTKESIKRILAGGTPRWLSHPEEYKQLAIESYLADKEQSISQVREYRMDDQEQLVDFRARNVNIISTKEFVSKLQKNGIKCFVCYNGMPQTLGLWCIVPTKNGVDLRYACYMQSPAMIEYSVLRLDEHGLPNGEDYRGWRTVLSEMIKKEIITEKKAHEIFGRPTESIVSRRYRRTLFEFRNRRVLAGNEASL